MIDHNKLLDPLYAGEDEVLQVSKNIAEWESILKQCKKLKAFLGQQYSGSTYIRCRATSDYDGAYMTLDDGRWNFTLYCTSYHNGDQYGHRTYAMSDDEVIAYLNQELERLKEDARIKIETDMVKDEVERRLRKIIDE